MESNYMIKHRLYPYYLARDLREGNYRHLENFYSLDVDVADKTEVLAFANVVREAGGADPISALLPSSPDKPTSCLLANAFNFHSSIRFDELFDNGVEQQWYMQIGYKQELAIDIGLAIGTTSEKDPYIGWRVSLPRHIGNAAHAFDQGTLFQEFVKNE
jgi:hypothetical protein